MKLILFVLVIFIFVNKVCSQTVIEIEIGSNKKVIKVDVTGTFAAGDTAWRKSIIKKFSSSIFKGAKKGKYTIKVYFIVSKDGSLSDIRCENDPGYGMCQEAVRVIKKNKKWTPAIQNGRSVTYLDSL